MSMFRAAFEGPHLSQVGVPPSLGPTKEAPGSITFPPRPTPPRERPETTSTMSPEEIKKLRELAPFAPEELDDLCFFLRLYRMEVEKGAAGSDQEKADAMAAAKRVLEKNKAIGWNLVDYASKYCDAGSHIVNELLRSMDLSQLSEQKPRPPVETPGARPRPGTPTPGVPGKTPTLGPVPTVPMKQPVPIAPQQSPTFVSQRLPGYMDVPAPQTLQYSPELQQQLDSYSQKLQQYASRPAAQPPAPVATPGGPGRCPPGQFWDGRKCRGSVDASAAGLLNAAGGAGATMGPSAFGPIGGGPTSFMGHPGRFRVENL